MTGTTSTKLATFEEFEGIEEISTEDTKNVTGGLPIFFPVFFALAKVVVVGGLKASVQVMKNNPDGINPGAADRPNQVSSGGGFGSDKRLKQDIYCEGAIDTLGVKVYSWEYKNAPGERFVGLMAQDLLARPDLAHAVFTFDEGPFAGFYGVNYGALGMTMLPEEAWDGDVRSLMLNQSVPA